VTDTPRLPARRGRRPGGNSEETRKALVDVALRHFAERGYAATSLTAVAADAGIATSAVYHYFEGKEQLYEAVFFAVAPQVWDQMAESVRDAPTMLAGIEALMRGRGGPRGPHVSPFLAGMPTVAVLHPEFQHLLDARTKLQDKVFRDLAALGLRNGELAGVTLDEATEVLRSFVMGWFFERFFGGLRRRDDVDGFVTAFRLMTIGAQHVVASGSDDEPTTEATAEKPRAATKTRAAKKSNPTDAKTAARTKRTR
jgi:AcrR family transcriptional regulator